jgi:hypothetical protein
MTRTPSRISGGTSHSECMRRVSRTIQPAAQQTKAEEMVQWTTAASLFCLWTMVFTMSDGDPSLFCFCSLDRTCLFFSFFCLVASDYITM